MILLSSQKEAIEKELEQVKAEKAELEKTTGNQASSEEVEELNSQISVMQEVIDSKDSEIEGMKKVG